MKRIGFIILNSAKKSALEWEKQAALGFDLRKQPLHHFRFAFRGYPHLLNYLKVISRGGSHAKRIQDLNDLAVLGRANRVILEAIPFDMSLLDQAAQASRRPLTCRCCWQMPRGTGCGPMKPKKSATGLIPG